MGMDVMGKNPTSVVGEYFRRSVWGWRPLWEIVSACAPELTGKVAYAQTNDGDGLDGDDSRLLAATLRLKLDSGEVAGVCQRRNERLVTLTDEACWLCKGTGVRVDMVVENGCNNCFGKKVVRPRETWYEASAEDVREFANFLECCGGFRIC